MADLTRKTANLFDINDVALQTIVSDGRYGVAITDIGTYTVNAYGTVQSNDYFYIRVKHSNNTWEDTQRVIVGTNITPRTATLNDGDTLYVFVATEEASLQNAVAKLERWEVMVNVGNSSLPYEPYGWVHSLRKLTTATEAVENPLYADGTAITSYTIKGNTVQSGTPTPSSPVEVQGVGNKTANLFSGWIIGKKISSTDGSESSDEQAADTDYIPFETDETYAVSGIDPNLRSYFSGYNAQKEYLGRTTASERSNITLTKNSFTLGTPQGTGDVKYLRCCITKALQSQPDISDINNYNTMLNVGSTAQSYEPYGYKIPISSGQQTIDIYIGDLPLLKSLDGTAVDEISNGTLTRRVDSDGSVLPTPTTTQITMPSIPTTQGANSITIDTTVQPSEFTATWTGWHDSSVKEYDGSDWQ